MKDDSSNSSGRHCPACDSANYVSRGGKGGFDMRSCRHCRTLYTAQLPNAENAEDYDNYYVEENPRVPYFINSRLDEVIADFAPYKQNGRLLDVGFGAGTLLEAARRGGWQAFGVEVSQRAVDFMRRQNFEVVCGTLAEAAYPNDYFDVVTASEVLEHVNDPQPILRDIARVVRPGGLVWLTTPHGRGVSGRMLGLNWSIVCPPEHLQLFSRSGSLEMLAAAGLKQVRLSTEGVNPYELLRGLPLIGQKQDTNANPHPGDERVEAGYRLNEALMASPSRRRLKTALNSLLSLGRLGDSLKIWAEK